MEPQRSSVKTIDLFGNPSFGHNPNKVPEQILHFFGLKPYKNAIFIWKLFRN